MSYSRISNTCYELPLLIDDPSKNYERDFNNSEILIKNLGKFNFLVVDNYQLDILWESQMRKYAKTSYLSGRLREKMEKTHIYIYIYIYIGKSENRVFGN